MTPRAPVGVAAALLALALVACGGGDDEGRPATATAAPTSGATGVGVPTEALVEAATPTTEDLTGLVASPEPDDPSEGLPERVCGAVDTVLADGPRPELDQIAASDERNGRDGGVRYAVVVQVHVAVYSRVEDATAALDAVDAGPWEECVDGLDDDDVLGRTTVDGPDEDGRVAVDAELSTGPGDDTQLRAGVRLTRVGRTVVVVGFATSGQVLDSFDDDDPVDALTATLADRVAALG